MPLLAISPALSVVLKMDAKIVFLVLIIALGVSCVDRTALYKEPPGTKSFDLDKYMGRWYIVSTVNQCSWHGADKFSDWFHEYKLGQTPGVIDDMVTWRKDMTCVEVPVKLTMSGSSSYIIKDTIGDMGTSNAVIVATDHTCFAITWGCSKRAVDGQKCTDPWVDLKTRKPYITPEVRRIAGEIFKKLWGLSIEDLVVVSHNKPCDKGTATV